MQTKACSYEIFFETCQILTRLQWLLSNTSNGLQLKCTFENDDRNQRVVTENVQFIKSHQVQLQGLQTADMNQPCSTTISYVASAVSLKDVVLLCHLLNNI